MHVVTLAQWASWNGTYSLLPYIMKIPPSAAGSWQPAVWDRFWEAASPYASLLESGKEGRYTMVGSRPVEILAGRQDKAEIRAPDGEAWRIVDTLQGSPLDIIRQWLGKWRAPRPESFPDCCCGGAIGYLSYDVVRSLEKLPTLAADDLQLPEYLFQRFNRLWVVDHREQAAYAVVHVEMGDEPLTEAQLAKRYREAESAAEEMVRQWRAWCEDGGDPAVGLRLGRMRSRMEADRLQIDVERIPGLSTSMDKEAFRAAVLQIQQYIRQGDVFQVNLSLRQSLASDVAPEQLYEWLRQVNPSPYMGMLRTPGFSLVSGSPELLVKLDDGRLSARPIAGTRRRGRSPEEDQAMEAELLSSEKERAEHIMLVDLERNDLGRVAAYGSVKVPELLTVERYSHVMHLVSQVEARLAPGKDALDVVAAMFPGGTITGAPKIRTMEIIEELEPVRRGPYTGSMGWIDYAGNMEFNIIIRTIACVDGMCHIQAGAGIVIDSDPEREFYECLNKAKALWKTVQYAQMSKGGNASDSGH